MIRTAPCRITAREQFFIEAGNIGGLNIGWEQHVSNLQSPEKRIPYRPGAQWPIGARGTKGDWRLPMIHNLQYWDVLVKKIIGYTFLPSGFVSPTELD